VKESEATTQINCVQSAEGGPAVTSRRLFAKERRRALAKDWTGALDNQDIVGQTDQLERASAFRISKRFHSHGDGFFYCG
jgi:hypothetical protein